MSSRSTHDRNEDGERSEPTDGADSYTREELVAQVEVLREQNRRLREDRLRSRQQSYRRSATGLAVLGLVGVVAGLVFPDARTVLFALGGTGLFGGVLAYVLTPERFIAESVGSGVYDSLAADREAIVEELGLGGDPVYVPGNDPRLYVPAVAGIDTGEDPDGRFSVPAPESLDRFFVVGDGDEDRGVAMHPTGAPLFEEFQRSLSGPLASTPSALTQQLADGVVEGFELADCVDTSVDRSDGRATLELSGVAYGGGDRLDHPVCSLFATGLAVGLDTAIRVDIDDTDPLVVTYRWDTVTDESDTSDETAASSDATPNGAQTDGKQSDDVETN